MSRVKIEDLKPPTKELDVKDMKKLYGGNTIVVSLNFKPQNQLDLSTFGRTGYVGLTIQSQTE
jgi:hypothetical protein